MLITNSLNELALKILNFGPYLLLNTKHYCDGLQGR